MTKKILSLFLVLSFVSVPFQTLHGAPPVAEVDTFTEIVHALSTHVTRLQGSTTVTPLTEDELRAAITAGVAWLKNAQEDDGHFKYEYVPYRDTYRNDDNVVRQAGALYALGEIVRHTERDALRVGDTMQKSITYFENLSRAGAFHNETFRCIVKHEASTRCPLGATALALVGTLSYVESHPKEAHTYASLIADYRSYILSMQKENGGFRDLYIIGSKTPSEKESAFSNGEALLALVRIYMYTPSPEVKNAIDRAFTYLAAQPYDANLYLWIMAALKDMETLWPLDIYSAYAHEFTIWRVMEASRLTNHQRNYCAYSEGLASALSLLKEKLDAPEYTRYITELNTRNKNHEALQITTDDRLRVIIENGVLRLGTLKNTQQAIGGFLTGDAEPTQRIDFTQHCITGYLHTLVDIENKSLK